VHRLGFLTLDGGIARFFEELPDPGNCQQV
jgi:hypothetical protein